MSTKQEAVNQQVIKLPKFEGEISIKVEIQAIYERLLAEFPNDYKHKEIVAHAIVGSIGNRSFLYNALNGYTNEIDFEKGEMVNCTEEERKERYNANIENEEGSPIEVVESDAKPNWKMREVKIGNCLIIDVDRYRDNKLLVRFMSWDRWAEKPQSQEAWVNHKNCTKIGHVVS